MSGFNPRWIAGKTVSRVDMRPFDSGHVSYGKIAHDPVIHFTDGSCVSFVTEETEVGVYGVDIVYRKAGRS